MVFCFLSTSVLYIVSLLVFVLSICASVIFYETALIPASILMLISFFSILLSHIGSKKLYDCSMSLTSSGFDKWYSVQKGVAKRCSKRFRGVVLLNMAFVCCAFERTAECRSALMQARAHIDRSDNVYYRFVYLMNVLALKEKTHDMRFVNELFSEILSLIKSPQFPKYESRKRCLEQYRYNITELQCYMRTPVQLTVTDRELTVRLGKLSLENSKKLSKLAELIGYSRLSYLYNAGLALTILGNEADADRLFNYIADSPYEYPLCERVRRYLIDRDINRIMEVVP